MNLSDITPLILTYNEEPNVTRVLERLRWAREVVVLDSFSTDRTVELAKGFPNVRVESRAFDDHTTQWNHGISLCPTPWVLSMDGDYVLPDAFPEELRALPVAEDVDAYQARFRYTVFGKDLRAALYPPRALLFRKERCTYIQDGHTQLLKIPGRTEMLQSFIQHDDRKPLTRWISSQSKYAEQEAEKLAAADPATLPLQDRLRRMMVVAPVVSLLYCLIFKGLILDGWRGWYYCWQRMVAEIFLSLRLLERKLHSRTNLSDTERPRE